MLHYDTVYLCPSHLDMAASFASAVVGVGGGGPQLQQRGIGGPWGLGWFWEGREGLRGGIIPLE